MRQSCFTHTCCTKCCSTYKILAPLGGAVNLGTRSEVPVPVDLHSHFCDVSRWVTRSGKTAGHIILCNHAISSLCEYMERLRTLDLCPSKRTTGFIPDRVDPVSEAALNDQHVVPALHRHTAVTRRVHPRPTPLVDRVHLVQPESQHFSSR